VARKSTTSYSTTIPRVIVSGSKAANLTSEQLAKEIATVARRLAPRDTGFLRKQIKAEKRGRTQWEAVANTNYAGFVEFGTSISAAQPFMRPAADQANRELRKRMRVTLKKQIGAARPRGYGRK
jgi:HK97 gp10 family phage protein